MHKSQSDVREFHRAFDLPTSPNAPALRDVKLRASLILEETFETIIGMLGTQDAGTAILDALYKIGYTSTARHSDEFANREPNFVETIDGLCDLKYVVEGTFEAFGVDGEPFWDEVHRSNMMKVNGPRRADGKILKPADWTPPDIAGVLAKMLVQRTYAEPGAK